MTVRCVVLLVLALVTSARAERLPLGLLGAAAAPTAELQILSPTLQATSRLRWIAWSDDAQGQRQAAHLALLVLHDSGADLSWSIARQDGYGTAIELVPNWPYAGRPTLLFIYQMGAAAQELELYGLSRQDRPVSLGSLEAEVFDLRPLDGFTIESVNGNREPRRCHRLPPAGRELVEVPCPK